jgi:hypothetical protein
VFADELSSLSKGDINTWNSFRYRFYRWDRENMHIIYNVVHVQCTCITCIECVVCDVVRCYSFTMYGELGTNIYPALSLLYICSPLKLLSSVHPEMRCIQCGSWCGLFKVPRVRSYKRSVEAEKVLSSC